MRCCHNAAHRSRFSRTLCLRDLYSCDGNLSGCWHRWASPHPLDTQRRSNVCIFQGGSNWRSGRNLRRQGTDKTIARTRGVNWLNRPPRNSNDAIAIQSYCASPAKRDTNSLVISYLEGACSFDEKGFWVALMKGSPRLAQFHSGRQCQLGGEVTDRSRLRELS